MRIERLSVKGLTLTIVLVLGLVPLAHTFYAKLQFRDAALAAEIQTLSRVVEVAADEVLKQVRTQATELGYGIQNRLNLRNALATDPAARANLQGILDEPFTKGFVSARTVDLIKLRVWDLALGLVAESGNGGQRLRPTMPPALRTQAETRSGVERLKAVAALWHEADRPYYSILIPIGGLRPSGYLEVVVSPLFNLQRIEEMVGLPLRIESPSHDLLYAGDPTRRRTNTNRLPIPYRLTTSDGATAAHLTVMENVDTLYEEMHNTQMRTTAFFLTLTAVVLLGSLWVLNRFLFRPVARMTEEMGRSSQHDFHISVDTRGLKEFHRLAKAFNALNRKVRDHTLDLHRLSTLDGLTGLANRRAMEEHLQHEWKRGERTGTPLTVILLDIDHFKHYNDNYGHLAGDDCLKTIGEMLAKCVTRPADLLARYGGEEFLAVLPDTNWEGGRRVAARFIAAVESLGLNHQHGTGNGRVTISAGTATVVPSARTSPEALVEHADRSLYRAKADGRNCFASAPFDLTA